MKRKKDLAGHSRSYTRWLRMKRNDLLVSFLFIVVVGGLGWSGYEAFRHFKESPPYVSPDRYPVRGIDISSHNGNMNLYEAAKDGVEFAFIKASEGSDFKDKSFRRNYYKARNAGIKTGAYHFFRFDKGGIEQGKNLLEAIDNIELDLGIAIDVENTGNATGVGKETIIQNLAEMAEFLNMNGYRPIVYTNKEGLEEYIVPSLPGSPLWICSFNEIPINGEWLFWQFDHHGQVKGINGDVDLNTFCGDRRDWDNFLERQKK